MIPMNGVLRIGYSKTPKADLQALHQMPARKNQTKPASGKVTPPLVVWVGMVTPPILTRTDTGYRCIMTPPARGGTEQTR